MLKLARFRRLDNRMSSGAELGKANLVAPMSTSFPNAIATDCQQDEFRWGHGPLTFERVRAAMGLA